MRTREKNKERHQKRSGAGGSRTRDLFVANETLYQLSYNPNRAAGRDRTDDLPLTRRLLYQLSYGSIAGVNPLRLGIPLEPRDVANG